MKSLSIKIPVASNDYAGIDTLAGAVIVRMTGNVNFPAPSPSLATLQTAQAALSHAITACGTAGHRGSKSDFAELGVASWRMLELLKREASYVMGLVDRNAPVLEQEAFIASSGFEMKSAGSPQGVLQPPQNVRQLINQHYSPYTPKIKWTKPQGLLSRKNVKLYHVFRSSTWNFSDAVKIGVTTRTSFIDMTAPKGAMQYYFVAGMNTAGLGVVSDGIEVPMPN